MIYKWKRCKIMLWSDKRETRLTLETAMTDTMVTIATFYRLARLVEIWQQPKTRYVQSVILTKPPLSFVYIW